MDELIRNLVYDFIKIGHTLLEISVAARYQLPIRVWISLAQQGVQLRVGFVIYIVCMLVFLSCFRVLAIYFDFDISELSFYFDARVIF